MSPPVGPALGSKGINIMEFCKQFNARTQDKAGKILMPKAEECAQIFASNIKAQNKSYREELEAMPVSKRAKMAQQLFATNLEKDSFWLDIINQECTANMDACHLKLKERNDVNESEKEDDVYVWSSSSRPKNKLMTGADISALIKEAKFLIKEVQSYLTRQTAWKDELRQGKMFGTVSGKMAF